MPALPNLKGQFEQNALATSFVVGNGVYADITHDGSANCGTGSGGWHFIYKFNASKSNPIYTDDCNTVQPPTIALIPQIKF